MGRGVVLICAVALLALLAVEASAERRSGTDRRSGFSFELNGAALTVKVAPGPSVDDARNQVFGELVVAVCFDSYDFGPRSRVVRRMVWPAGQDALTFTFDRDISAEAKSCLIESDGGGDFADVSFGPGPAVLRVQTSYSDGQDIRAYRSFVRLRASKGRSVLTARGRDLTRLVEPGRYRLIRYDRRCLGSCRRLGPPIRRCARRILLPSGRYRLFDVDVDSRRGSCRIRVHGAPRNRSAS